jgi:hypothetical protein
MAKSRHIPGLLSAQLIAHAAPPGQPRVSWAHLQGRLELALIPGSQQLHMRFSLKRTANCD